jgi:homoserine dehydrogenase
MENKSYSVAVLGAGNIGSAVITRLQELDTDIVNINLTKVLVSDISKDRDFDKTLLTENIKDIVDDDSIDLVIEVLGGIEPGKEYIKSLLSNGKAVITAHKDIIADCGNELVQLAQENNTCLYFEAAVAAGIPVLKPLIESLRGEDLSRVTGIINGTSNYILTSMEEGSSYGDALITAQELGYAEPDPTNDVEGIDAMYKTMILSLICFGATPDKDNVHTEGISSVTKEDFDWASRLNKTIKLVALIDNEGSGFNARVHPVLIDTKHPLAAIRGALNAVVVEGENINQLVFSGPGAGAAPTASAVIGDVLSACHQLSSNQSNWYPLRSQKNDNKNFDDVSSSWFIRLSVTDEPGVLASIAGTFSQNNVSIESVIQEGRGEQAELVLVTHEAPEKDMQNSIKQISSLDPVTSVTSTLRVYS